MKMTRVWEILSKFKNLCKCHGWKTSESEDWIEIDNNYHNFLWARDVHFSSFKRLVSDRKCVVREGLCYHVVQPSYTAWLFPEAPSVDLVRTVLENPDFSRRIALYDLSPFLEGKRRCVKLNNTDSPVFREFESFLQKELKVKLEPVPPLFDTKTSMDSCSIPALA
jgi:hypothetical protein